MAHGFSLSSRVILINAVLFTLATAVLALSPATVSSPTLPSQLLVLVVGLAVVIVTNAFLVRASLVPLDRQKLGMRDRTELTRYAIRVGLIEP